MKSSLAEPSLCIINTARKLMGRVRGGESKLPVGFFDAAINHFDEDVGVLVEFNHQLLLFLHVSEGVLVY